MMKQKICPKKQTTVKAIQLQAKIATLVTAFSRVRKGLEPIAPKTDLGYAANFLYMLSGEEPEDNRN